jgi:hypothetical protein
MSFYQVEQEGKEKEMWIQGLSVFCKKKRKKDYVCDVCWKRD